MKRRKPILYDDRPAANGEVSQVAAGWYLVGSLWLSNRQIIGRPKSNKGFITISGYL